jgi:polyisoprenyl-teichoic acid--peptidoglycan teichoic acid transferase
MMKSLSRYGILVVLLCMLGVVLVQPTLAQIPTFTPPAITPWDGKSRFTVLVLGMDRRPGARDNLSTRTDVMVLVSYDPETGNVGMLHIPRDIHLPMFDTGVLARVNTMMVLGEQQSTGYGPYYAMQTIQANFGMYVDAYLAFDFEAFITLIDAMDGIAINVPYAISDPTYPDMNFGYDPFYISSGLQILDGRTALKYARTRHGDNDYLRGQRQMLVMQGVQDRLTDPTVLQGMLLQAPTLAADLNGHIYTNLPFDQLTYLGLVVLENRNEVITGGLNESNTYLYPAAEGEVRIPDREGLTRVLIEVFGANYWN